jgi:hypothetical protein
MRIWLAELHALYARAGSGGFAVRTLAEAP